MGFESGSESSFETSAEIGGDLKALDEGVRSKTSLRINYEAQVSVIKKQLGSLENLRLNLGLSQRKMAQLLLVDPSSWTRWTKNGDEAPPHIWRALQWYGIIREKIPGLTPQYFTQESPQVYHQKALQELEQERLERQSEWALLHERIEGFSDEKRTLQNEVSKLQRDLKLYKRISLGLCAGVIFIGILVGIKGLL